MVLTVALVGNPNVGKSAIFNALTNLNQNVSNFPRTTVERKEGSMDIPGFGFCKISDLPGIYSLTANSLDEIVSRNFIIDQKPELVINIVDSSNLEHHLYLTVQLLELQVPMIICFNKIDIAEKMGIKIDYDKIGELLGTPIIKTIAYERTGIKELRKMIKTTLKSVTKHHRELPEIMILPSNIEEPLKELSSCFKTQKEESHRFSEHSRWMAIKYLEGDSDIINRVEKAKINGKVKDIVKETLISDPPLEFAKQRYSIVEKILKPTVKQPEITRTSVTELLDDILTHKWLGIPIFITMMWLVFQTTFALGEPFMLLVELIFYYFGNAIEVIFGSPEISPITAFLHGTVVDGLGSIVIFLPNIVILFLAIAVLEDSGYMARAAFNVDRILSAFGLHGQSFIPMALGIGCTIPAIMSTRSIRGESDRLITILVSPFISCSARLPVYVLFAGAFFPGNEGNVIFSLYLLGIIVAIIMALIFRKTLFREQISPFLIEFPPYLRPRLNAIVLKAWVNAKLFLRKAGYLIFLSVSIIWIMNELGLVEPLGKVMQPFFSPFGLDWQLSASLLFGFIAKEVVVGALGTMYGDIPEGNLTDYLAESSPLAGNPAAALGYVVFVLLYLPCVAAIGAIKGETNSWKWTMFSIAYTTIVAYIAALIVMLTFSFYSGIFGV